MNEFAELITNLSPEQRELFLLQLNEFYQVSYDVSREQIIPRRRDSDSFPLSFAQQRLWFIDQLDPGTPAYNIPSAIRLTGSLNVNVLKQSINEVIQRHETLRAIFTSKDGKPVQIVAPSSNLTLPVVDLRELPDAEQEIEARRLAFEAAQFPFDLVQGPLLHASALWLDAEEHIMLFTMHHIISDGWSMAILIQEVAAFYEALCEDKRPFLPELAIQYTDFAAWQRQWLQGKVLDEQLSYWRERLGGAPGVLALPTDRPRPPVQSFCGTTQSLSLSEELSEALYALSQREGATLFMTLLAAFETLLYRYTGQEDILVGSSIANRNRSEVEGLIGFFVNTLVLRTDLSNAPTFRELLARVKEMTLGAYAHQDVPFEMLVDALHPERDMSRTPLFQVMFVLQNTPREALELPHLSLEPLSVDTGTSKFDLTLFMFETESGLKGMLEYSTDLFNASTITRMLEHFQILLQGIAADPEQSISALPLSTDIEQKELANAFVDDLYDL